MQPRTAPTPVRRLVLRVFALSIAVALSSGHARADDEGSRFLLEGFLGVIGGELTTRPTLSSFHTPGSLSYPGIQNVSVTAGSTPGGGLDVHGGLRMNGRFGVDFPLGGLRIVFATDDARLTLHGDGGQTASLDLVEMVGTIALPGVGAHATFGPAVLTASIHPVLQWGGGWGSVTQGFISADISSYPSFDLGIDADVRLCRSWGRDSPALCATVEPLLWRTSSAQGGPFNGVLFGIGVQLW
jgi:hypothetical protein